MESKFRVNNYTIHFIDKSRNVESNEATASLDLSKSVLKHDEFSEKLIIQLHKSITESPSLKNTKFKNENENVFTTRLNNYFEDSSSESFYDYTLSLNELFNTITKIPFATGGYYLFADYEFTNNRYIIVTLLRKKDGINIIKQNDEFKLLSSENLSMDKIAMAFRLNYNIYINSIDEIEKNNYVALITTQQDGNVSEYFRTWVNAGDLIKNTQNTQNLLNLLKYIDLPKDENGCDVYKNRYDFQNDIFNYVKSNRRKLLNIYDISRHFYGEVNSNKIMNFAKENEIVLDPEFKKDPAVWKNLITIKAKTDGIELNINHNKFNDDNVKILDDTIIIYSKDLVNKINSEIAKIG